MFSPRDLYSAKTCTRQFHNLPVADYVTHMSANFWAADLQLKAHARYESEPLQPFVEESGYQESPCMTLAVPVCYFP